MPSPPSTPAQRQLRWSRSRQRDSLQAFLAKLESVRRDPLHELEALLLEAKAVHLHALQATTARAEKEALHRAESCAERASAAAARTCRALQDLTSEVDALSGETDSATERRLRRQSFAGVSVLFQNSLNAYFQAQQEFRAEMEAKVSRQLRAAFPEADDAAVAAVAAGHHSAASAIQDTVRLQPGSSPLSGAMALQATRERCDELESLAKAARELRQAFLDVESLVHAQGDFIDDIEGHVSATRVQTKSAQEQLELANASRRACRCRWCALLIIFLSVAVIFILVIWEQRH